MTDLDPGADLRERFDHAMHDLSAPDGLTDAALTDGHRLRRRRRVLTASTGVAAAAAVAALVTASLGGGAPSTGPQVATQPPHPRPEQRTSPTDAPPDLDAPGWWSMPAPTMAQELAALLPDGMQLTDAETINTDRAPGRAAPGDGGLPDRRAASGRGRPGQDQHGVLLAGDQRSPPLER